MTHEEQVRITDAFLGISVVLARLLRELNASGAIDVERLRRDLIVARQYLADVANAQVLIDGALAALAEDVQRPAGFPTASPEELRALFRVVPEDDPK